VTSFIQGAFAFFLTVNQNDVYSPDVNCSITGEGFTESRFPDRMLEGYQRVGRCLTLDERIQQLVENPLHVVRFHLAKMRSVHRRLLNGQNLVLGGPVTDAVKGQEAQRGGIIGYNF